MPNTNSSIRKKHARPAFLCTHHCCIVKQYQTTTLPYLCTIQLTSQSNAKYENLICTTWYFAYYECMLLTTVSHHTTVRKTREVHWRSHPPGSCRSDKTVVHRRVSSHTSATRARRRGCGGGGGGGGWVGGIELSTGTFFGFEDKQQQ